MVEEVAEKAVEKTADGAVAMGLNALTTKVLSSWGLSATLSRYLCSTDTAARSWLNHALCDPEFDRMSIPPLPSTGQKV